MRIKPALCTILLLCSPVLSGCWDRVEINDLAFVMASSLDITDQGELLGTIQIAIPTPSTSGAGNSGGGGGGAASGNKVIVTSMTGRDIEDLVQKEQEKLSRKIYISHRSILLIGEKLARRGIQDVLDHIGRDPNSRLRTYILVTKGMEAREFLKLQYPFERYPAEAIRELENSGVGSAVTLRDFLKNSSSQGVVPVTGVVEPSEREGNDQLFRLSGTAIFKNFKLAGYLDDEETRGLMWLTGKMKQGTITAYVDGASPGYVSMRLRKADHKITPEVLGGRIKMNIEVKGDGAIYENNTKLDLGKPQNIQIVQDALKKALKKRIQRTISRAKKDYQADIFGFGREIHRKRSKQWKALKDEWEQRYPEVETSLKVNLTVRRSGMSGPSLHLNENEVGK